MFLTITHLFYFHCLFYSNEGVLKRASLFLGSEARKEPKGKEKKKKGFPLHPWRFCPQRDGGRGGSWDEQA